MLYQNLSYQIISACMAVHNSIGPGLAENCYHKALELEFKQRNIKAVSERPFFVRHLGEEVGKYFADLVIEDKIILELKSVLRLTSSHQSQLLNYLRISGFKLGFLFNFQNESLKWERLARR